MNNEIYTYKDSLNNIYNLYITNYIAITINGLIVFVSYQGRDRVLQIFKSEYYNYGDDLNNVSNILIENSTIIFNHESLRYEIVLDNDDYHNLKNWIIDCLTPIDIKRNYKLNNIISKLLKKLHI
ncbi:hypothetical protein [Trichloromonas sp.]|uniref:hypothetical protein n=1 Tax=Trichloromonas sp. TaxID=3069249 RepID=UPI002A3BA881|nr:hypothetical protein [Trichloromonas sp.]